MTEHDEQAAVIAWARLQESVYPELRCLFAIPNAGKRSMGALAYYKAEGLKSGVPDLFLACPNQNRHHGLFIEMKVTGGKISPNQNAWHVALRNKGYRVVVCWSAEEAIREIENYIVKLWME